MVEMPQGTYTVAVNGVETSFDWEVGGQAPAPVAPESGELRPITVEDVRVEVGVGSPIPVDVVVSGTWPDLCAQIARIEQRLEGSKFEISLLAIPAAPGCPPDQLGLPFRIAFPLNMVEMEVGAYSVVVNGVEAAFEWNAQPGELPQEPAGPTSIIAYIGADGNVWVMDGQSGESRQITQDATPGAAGGSQPAGSISYFSPALSSDGMLLAYRRDAATPVESGMQYQIDFWVVDLASGESRQVIVGDQYPAGFAWKPGTHLLAFGQGVAEGYFGARGGKPNADLATGIWAVDLDQGDPFELVRPERGYTLVAPVWSPDGRFLSFDEVYLYEGRGQFSYYDFEAQQYVAWDEPIGGYSWSPDGSLIAYDRLTYIATGEERIFLRERQGGTERQFSPDFEQGYAFYPVFSPQGDRLAYLAGFGGPDSNAYTLFVQPLAGGEPQELGVFDGVLGLSWSPDGESLVFSSGPYDAQQVILVQVADGASTVLAQGSDPALVTP
jgi:Tol biopolymer transport system component